MVPAKIGRPSINAFDWMLTLTISIVQPQAHYSSGFSKVVPLRYSGKASVHYMGLYGIGNHDELSVGRVSYHRTIQDSRRFILFGNVSIGFQR